MPEHGNFNTNIGNIPVTVHYKIHADKKCECTFIFLTSSYTFKMTKWRGKNTFQPNYWCCWF